MLTRERVRTLLAQGKGVNEIARELGITRSTVSFHRRRLRYEVDDRCNRRYDWTEIQRYYDTGHTKRDCQLKFGFCAKTWYEAVQRGALAPRPAAAPIETYLVRDRRVNRFHLKARLLAAGLKEECCERCGIKEWLDERLSMALHHINGNGLDNRLENLQLLCPNCHSQTPNFGSRNMRRRRAAPITPELGIDELSLAALGPSTRLPVLSSGALRSEARAGEAP